MSQDIQGVNNVEETQHEPTDAQNTSSPSVDKSEEATNLEAEKKKLEDEINGLEGTRKSILDDVARIRQERKEAKGEVEPVIDVESMKRELSEELSNKLKAELAEQNAKFLKQQADLQNELIKAKKATLDSINARMASASGSKGQASSDSIVENEVELSNDEKKMAEDLKLKNPRYLKNVEVHGL